MRLPPPLTRAMAPAGSLTLGAVLAVTVLGVTVLGVTAPARAETTCRANGTVTMGKYWLINDIRGEPGSGWQCVWNSWRSGSTIGWGTSWSWRGRPGSVKSFAGSVLGWHWGWKTAGTGLPVRLSEVRSVKTRWRFQAPTSGSFDVAYNLWLHDVPGPDVVSEPTDEVIIWLYRSGGAKPLGAKVAEVKVAGTTWDLYRGRAGWNVYSFVRTSSTSSAAFDLTDFLDELTERRGLEPDKYLSSVEAGVEVFSGSGQLITSSYHTNVG